jgi:hypothetical protein
VALALALVDCSLLVDTSGLAGTAVAPDASGSSEASLRDVEQPDQRDAASTPAPDGAGFQGCTLTPHEICDDFDNGALGARWSQLLMSGGGKLELVDGAVSPPNALLASAKPISSGASAALAKTIGRRIRTARCELDLRLAQTDNLQILAFNFTPNSSVSDYTVRLAFSGANSTLFEDGYPADGGSGAQTFGPAPDIGKWVHLVVTLATQPGNFTLVMDGLTVLQQPLTPPDSPIARVYVGEDSSPSGFSAMFDNVFCDLN